MKYNNQTIIIFFIFPYRMKTNVKFCQIPFGVEENVIITICHYYSNRNSPRNVLRVIAHIEFENDKCLGEPLLQS